MKQTNQHPTGSPGLASARRSVRLEVKHDNGGTQLIGDCMCKFCAEYAHEKVADILGCKCFCHTEDGFTGHDSLCCPYPNALQNLLIEAAGLQPSDKVRANTKPESELAQDG